MNTPMKIMQSQTIPIQTEQDIVKVRKQVREMALLAQFSMINQTKIVTAASELARNVFRYGGQGTAQLNLVNNGTQAGVQLIFTDEGPGIPNITQAMTDGFSTGKSLGMGLSGSKRLVDEFSIASKMGEGTCVTVLIWK